MAGRAPRVSVLVPVFNSAATLERSLRSACAQTMQDIEILVADDASTDDSAACAEQISREDPRVTVLRLGTNGGKPRAMNIMMAQARGEWVAVLDADDAIAPERLAHLIDQAERLGVDMATDNLLYVDSGVVTKASGFGTVLRTAFDVTEGDRIIDVHDLLRSSDNHADFDYGLLKPIIRRNFVVAHGLVYNEGSRLAEDFTYLLDYMIADGRALLCSRPMYLWTMPFGTLSRRWTSTGAGAWRYDYRAALAVNSETIVRMRSCGREDVAGMLERRGRQYAIMMHYIGAQREAADGRFGHAAMRLAQHPSTWRLLARRVIGRVFRWIRAGASPRQPA